MIAFLFITGLWIIPSILSFCAGTSYFYGEFEELDRSDLWILIALSMFGILSFLGVLVGSGLLEHGFVKGPKYLFSKSKKSKDHKIICPYCEEELPGNTYICTNCYKYLIENDENGNIKRINYRTAKF